MGLREDLKQNGWRQCHILDPNEHRSLRDKAHYQSNDGDKFLIVTQTCDLINDSVEQEPYFEVLCIHPLDRDPSPGEAYGKIGRRIEFSILMDGNTTHWQAYAHERHLVDRSILRDLRPAMYVEDDQTRLMLLRWIASRYTRTAFPETFDQRWKPRRKEIEKCFKNNAMKSVKEIYLRLSPFSEVAASQEYQVEILFQLPTLLFNDAAIRTACADVARRLEDQLNRCEGIEVTCCLPRADADITLYDLAGYQRWDYSHLSYREQEGAELPTDF